MARSNVEHKIQSEAITQLRIILPAMLGSNCAPVFAIPNGGNRDAATGAILKREGVVAGVPDLFLPFSAGGYGGLFIEVKAPGGVVSPAQKDMIQRLRGSGYAVALCRSTQSILDEAIRYLRLRG